MEHAALALNNIAAANPDQSQENCSKFLEAVEVSLMNAAILNQIVFAPPQILTPYSRNF